VRREVGAFRELVQAIIEKRGTSSAREAESEDNTLARLFEEIKVMLSDLPDRMRNPRRFEFRPAMIEEFLRATRDRAASWLMFISLFRDDCPWLYELGMDVYRAFRDGTANDVTSAMQRLHRMGEACVRDPWTADMLGSHEVLMMVLDMPDILKRFLVADDQSRSSKRGRRARGEEPPPPEE